MPGGKSNYLADKIGDHMHGGPDYTRPATTYFAMMTVTPTSSGGGTEASGGGYARLAYTNNSTNWPASSGQTKLNATVMDWGTFTAALGTIVAIAEYDSSSGGNLLSFGPLSSSRVLATGDSFQVPISGGTYQES